MSFHDLAPAGGTRLRSPGLAVQRQCSCGNHAAGGECESCKRRKMMQRSDRSQPDPLTRASARPSSSAMQADLSGVARASTPRLTAAPMIQRQGVEETAAIPEAAPAPSPAAETAPAAAPEAAPSPAAEPASPEETAATPEAAPAASTETAGGSSLLAEDGTTDLGPGQQRKTEFLDQLQSTVCARADAVLAASGRSTEGCPYLTGWFAHYRGQSASYVESALRRYAPETRNARTAAEYIPLIASRVEAGVRRWAATGEVSGVPDGLPTGMAGLAGAGGALGAVGSAIGGMFFKAKEGGARASDDPAAVQRSLGGGQPLESSVRGRMEQAFGQSFSHVRTHTDANAGRVSSEQNARAFTVGSDVAFGSGEFQPGTMVGDALIAHELAHVVQQGGASPETQAKPVSGASYNALERDADDAAVGAVASLWGGMKGAASAAGASLKSGLQLQRCKSDVATCSAGTKTLTVDFIRMSGATGSPAADLTSANALYKQCCVQFTQGQSPTPETPATTTSWLGGDTDAKVTPNCGTVDPEEKTMYDNATTKYGLSSRMRVFYVSTFTGSAGAGYSIPPYCASGSASAYANHVVLQNSASGATNPLAHEFGHILLNSGNHGTAPNLMGPSGGTVIDPGQCKTIYNNA